MKKAKKVETRETVQHKQAFKNDRRFARGPKSKTPVQPPYQAPEPEQNEEQ
jgi:hypothetical protein